MTRHDQYHFRLSVDLPNGRRVTSGFNVDAWVAKASKWSPYDECSDSFTAALAGGVTRDAAARIDTERKRLAEDISAQLTEHILNSIKASDTVNGYVKEE